MRYTDGKQWFRMGLSAVAAAGMIAGPAFAFGGMGFGGFGPGFGGGFHGGFRSGTANRAPIRPAIDTPTPKPPFTNPPPPMHMHDHDHDQFFHAHFHDHFHNHFQNGFGWGWGGWGGGYDVYAASGPGEAEPVYVAEREAKPPEQPPCPELLTWSPKLGRATRQRLCETD